MAEWNKDWSSWLQEGYFISYYREGVRYYEYILARDFAHYEYDWPETIATLTESGPYVDDDLEITKGYVKESNVNYFWQFIFGIRGEVYIYVELPTDLHRHGLPKRPKPSATLREVSHFTEEMSPFIEPTFITEHFLMRPDQSNIAWDAYNPNAIAMAGVKLNIMIAKMTAQRIGYEDATGLHPHNDKLRDTLDKLSRRLIPLRPITLAPVRMPAEAPAGE